MKTKFDLEERTLKYAKEIRKQFKDRKDKYDSDIQQVLKSSGSIGANYIEANEALSKKDFLMRIKISRKETKETIYWLKLISENDIALGNSLNSIIEEGYELLKIFSSIINKSQEMNNKRFN
ncbi:four helix bundle protein [Bacteroidota bacterium]